MTDGKTLDDALELAKSLKVEEPKKIKKEAAVDATELTDAEKRELEAEAAKEVSAELKAQARKAFKEEAKKSLKKQKLFQAARNEDGAELETLTLNLAPHSQSIKLNGRVYYHGATYRLTRGTAAVIKEIAYRGWLHDAEIHGLDMNAFHGRQKLNATI